MWDGLVSFFELAIFLVGSAAGGSLGFGVFVVAATTRLATLPFTYRLAKKGRARRAALEELRDELTALKDRWKADPVRLQRETLSLYESRGITLLDRSSLLLMGIQAPVVLALFQAVRRTVTGSQLGSASIPIAIVASSLSTAAVLSGNQSTSGLTLAGFAILAAASAAIFTLTLGSGFGLYSAALQAVSTVQGLLLRRADRKALVATAA